MSTSLFGIELAKQLRARADAIASSAAKAPTSAQESGGPDEGAPPPLEVTSEPRAALVAEEAAFYLEAKRQDQAERDQTVKILKARSKRLRQDMKLRKEHAATALGLAQAAVGFWMFMCLATSLANIISGRPWLSDQALATVTAGATLNVIAVFLVVVRGLFPGPVEPKEKTLP